MNAQCLKICPLRVIFFSCSTSCFLLARHKIPFNRNFWKCQHPTCLTRVPQPVCEQVAVMNSLVLAFCWLLIREILTMQGCWLMVCPCLTCGSWARQVSQFRDRKKGKENTSSPPAYQMWIWNDHHCFPTYVTLYALPLSRQQSWICFSIVSAHFSDLCSLVTHKWWVRSLLCSRCLSQGLPVLKRPKCVWFSRYLILKSILMVSVLIDLQCYRPWILFYKHISLLVNCPTRMCKE